MMTAIAHTLAAASRSGTGQPAAIPQHRHKWPIRLGLLLCLLFGHASLQAQVIAPLPNLDLLELEGGQVYAAAIQSDGKVIIGGSFAYVNGVPRSNLARLNTDGSVDENWILNADGAVYALALDETNFHLYVGGDFLTIGGETKNKLARQDTWIDQIDSTFPHYDTYLNGPVKALLVDETEVYFGGNFTTFLGPSPSVPDDFEYLGVIRKTDSNPRRTYYESVELNGEVELIAVDASSPNHMFIGGQFTYVRGGPISHFARVPKATGIPDADYAVIGGAVKAVAQDVGVPVIVYVGGDFTSIGGYGRSGIAKIDIDAMAVDSIWNPVDVLPQVNALAIDDDRLYVGGAVDPFLTSIDLLTFAGEEDSSWTPGTNDAVRTLIKDGTNIYVGGDFSIAAGDSVLGIARIDDAGNRDAAFNASVATGLGYVNALAIDSDGTLYAGGRFDRVGSNRVKNLMRLSASGVLDSNWTPNPNSAVEALALNGTKLYVGGQFTFMDGQSQHFVARIDTTTGLVDGSFPDPQHTPDGDVLALAVDGTHLYLGGWFETLGIGGSGSNYGRIDTTTGQADTSYGNLELDGAVEVLAFDTTDSNYIFIAGRFNNFRGSFTERIARITKSSAVLDSDYGGAGPDGTVYALAQDGTDLYVGGVFDFFDTSGFRTGIARVNSNTALVDDAWAPSANVSDVRALAVDSSGLYVGGSFTSIGGQTRNRIARISTTTGLADASWNPNADGRVDALATGGDGVVYAGGTFTQIGTESRTGLAKILDTEQTCGSGVDINALKWTMISLPCNPLIWDQVGDLYGDELGISTYGNGNEWLMYDHDPSTNNYGLLDTSSQLQQGPGYWILSDNAAHLDIEGDLTPIVASTKCDEIPGGHAGCYEVTLTPPPQGTPKRWNLVGNPFPYPVAWRDARILVDGTTLRNATDAQTDGYGEKNIHIYENGTAYAAYDDQTPGMEGVLNPGQAFWYAVVMDDTQLSEIKLLIPDLPFTGEVTPPDAPAYSLFAGAWTVLREVADFVVPSAHADKPPDKGKPPKDDNPGHQRREARLQGKEWYVRLIAEWPEGGLKDRGNVLGQLSDSELGFDAHDLEELSPFSTPYLTIVFPHDDWGEKSGNYTSDYHPLIKGKSHGDLWQFEVRTDEPGREITLRWLMQGAFPQEPLLINVETGETVDVDPAVPGSYTFVMDATTQRFEWMY